MLRPWDHDSEYGLPEVRSSFTVLERTRLAVLDDDFAARIAPWPALAGAIVGRIGERARWLALRVAVSHLDPVDIRLLFLFAHLADRWGRVTSEGIVLALPLTHARVAKLIGARRPSVTTALGELGEREIVVRRPDGSWVLSHRLDEEIGARLGS